jgi:hypothetical protein
VPISPLHLVGRDADVSLLRRFVAQAADDGGALLVTGEPGVGKSALLNVIAREASRDGTLVLRAAGAEFEAALSFAGLGQLLGPVLGHLSELDETDQRAMRVSLGLADGTASEEQAVAGVVYICAFAPDQGESVSSLLADLPPDGPVPPILPPVDGFLFLDREKFAASFAADVPAREAAFMGDSQVPWGVDALGGMISDPAWRSKPSWYLVTAEDRMIPPPLQRTMADRAGATTSEVSGSHAIYVSQPAAVAGVITQAARSLGDTAGALASAGGGD